jgi:hypothetical protein
MNNKQLSILPYNKTTVFYSPIEGKDVLVRTGVINEGSSFIHSVLNSYSRDYVKTDDKEKIKTVNKLSKSVLEKVLRDKWEENFNISTMLYFQDGLRNTLGDFYKCINGVPNVKSVIYGKLSSNIDTYKIVCQVVKLEHFTKEILPETYNSSANKSLEKFQEELKNKTSFFCQKIFDNLGNSIDKKRKKYCMDKVINLISEVCEEVDSLMFKKHLNSKKDSLLDIDFHTVNFISDRVNRNIYFIDSRNRLPYKVSGVNYNKKKSVIVIWLGGYNYEPVGKLLEHNRIKRDFDDDKLIYIINSLLYDHKIIHSKYPDLVKYINKCSFKESRQRSNLNKSSSNRSQSSNSERSSPSSSPSSSPRSSARSNSEASSASSYQSSNSEASSSSKKSSPRYFKKKGGGRKGN